VAREARIATFDQDGTLWFELTFSVPEEMAVTANSELKEAIT
jgi:hypothetical protein